MRPEDSLDIIGKMMTETRKNVLFHSYMAFLIWGWTTCGVSLLVYIMLYLSHNIHWNYLWFLIIPIGAMLSKRVKPCSSGIRTGIENAMNQIWQMLALVMIGFSAASFILDYNILFIILLLLSIGSFTTGAIIGYPFLKYSSIPGFVLAISIWFIDGLSQIIIFTAAIAVMMIVPGYKMKQDLKKYE